ncbi:MAG: hypothetical protein Q8S02_12160 [Hydrogenophaga sp.]|nr:hypothetical protein [Hydrogenophaga sp.]
MEILFLLVGLAIVWRLANRAAQQRRIALLAQHLSPLRIEMLMSTLMEGYLRALGETDPQRQQQVWGVLATAEAEIETQMGRLAESVRAIDPAQARISRLPMAVPLIDQWWPQACFDLREALAIHARGVAFVRSQHGWTNKERAFAMTAELMLMQHTCHWYCQSRMVASARVLARHKTSHAQVLAGVSDTTREAYLRLTGGA